MNTTAARVILIGGTSNVGKSTLAQALAARLGGRWVSTDTLARHPGRPWGELATRPHVAEHYLSLSVDELIADVIRHYTTVVWPSARSIISAHASETSADRLILEGSALLPELVADLRIDGVAAIWLTASDELLRKRIYQVSNFDQVTPREQAMIDKFVARTHRYNRRMMEAVTRLNLPWLDVEHVGSPERITDDALRMLGIER